MSMSRYILTAALLAAGAFSIGSAYAADGCGPNGWRGPWGHCHWAHPVYVRYAQPVVIAAPRVVYAGPAYASAPMCPAGYWIGPWGHCRDTPYHGRLPNGQWQ
jgi:hypothetical protein